MGNSASGPLGYDRFGQHYSSFLYQQTVRCPFLYPVTSSCGSFSVTSISGHCPRDIVLGARHILGLSERDSRQPVLAKSANNDRVETPSRDRDSNLWDLGTPAVDMFVTVHHTHYSPLQRGEVPLYSALHRFLIIRVTLHRWLHQGGRMK